MNSLKIRRLTTAALCGAVAFVLKYLSFSVPFISPFAEFDLSALPELIGGFILGPMGAVAIVTVKVVLNLLYNELHIPCSHLSGQVHRLHLS